MGIYCCLWVYGIRIWDFYIGKLAVLHYVFFSHSYIDQDIPYHQKEMWQWMDCDITTPWNWSDFHKKEFYLILSSCCSSLEKKNSKGRKATAFWIRQQKNGDVTLITGGGAWQADFNFRWGRQTESLPRVQKPYKHIWNKWLSQFSHWPKW